MNGPVQPNPRKPSLFRWMFAAFVSSVLLTAPVGFVIWVAGILLGGGVSAHAQPPSPLLNFLLIELPGRVFAPFVVLIFADSFFSGYVQAVSLGIAYSFPLCFVIMLYFYRWRRRTAIAPQNEALPTINY